MESNYIQIKDLRPGMKNINVIFIVLEVGHPTRTKEAREVRTFKVADQTACANASIWDEAGQLLVPGDIVRLTRGYVSIWRNCLTLYTSKGGDLQKVGEFCMVFNEQLNMSEPGAALQPAQQAPGNATAPPTNLSNGASAGNGARTSTVAAAAAAQAAPAKPPPGRPPPAQGDGLAKRQRGSRGGQHRNRHARTT